MKFRTIIETTITELDPDLEPVGLHTRGRMWMTMRPETVRIKHYPDDKWGAFIYGPVLKRDGNPGRARGERTYTGDTTDPHGYIPDWVADLVEATRPARETSE